MDTVLNFNFFFSFFFFQAVDGIRDRNVTGVQTCALPISVAVSLPCDPPSTIGLPVINPGLLNSSIRLYSSIIHALICEFVITSRSEERRVGKECRFHSARSC